ncbi:MAG: hypothetical protein LBM68_03130 [Bacteroidales bacterium]|jgi:hypothetical protein|nr:hypothetical protein [Bacteroidales bacterium]
MKGFPNHYSCRCLHDISESLLLELSQFVVTTNYARHCGKLPPSMEEEIQEVYRDELVYAPHSRFYIVENTETQNIVGCIRIIRWDKQCVLPIEKEFNVNVHNFVNAQSDTVEQVFHMGRFAIAKETERIGMILFKTLLYNAFCSVGVSKNAIVFAELDEKLFRIFRLLNISSISLGQSKIELGSETIPAYIKAEGFKPFIEKHKNLTSHV